MNIQTTIENKMCSGCGMCQAICHKNAITLQYNTIGNLIPIINSNCVDCGLCIKVCPGNINNADNNISTEKLFIGEIQNANIGRSFKNDIYKNSQSGGIVTGLLHFLFEKELIDAAIVAKMQPGSPYPVTSPTIVTNKEQLIETQKSIYTPVAILTKLKEIKQYKSVAIVGLPCQFEALKLAQDMGLYKNVTYKIGLICDRILSRSVYLSLMPYDWKQNAPDNKDEYSVIFRDKRHNGYKTAYMLYKNKRSSVSLPPYPRHHVKDFFTHPRCRICFNKLNIYADITCGDPWNLDNVDWKNGDSLILTRTNKGEKLLSQALSDGTISLMKCEKEAVIKAQGINSRIKRCKASINVYIENGWEIPETYKRIDKSITKDYTAYKNEKKFINIFLKNENLPLEKILQESEYFKKYNSKKMARARLKNKIKRIVKRILTFK